MSTQPKRRKVAVKKKAAAGQGKRRKKGMTLEDRPLLEPNAGGIDIGAREIFVAVPAERDENPVRVFPTFTEDLEEMARWPVSCGVTTVSDGIHRGVLDSTIRCSGATWSQTLSGKRPKHEERTGAEDGLA